MKRIYLIAAIVLFSAMRLSAQSFEGTIDMTTSVPMLGISDLPVKVSAKGDRLKMVTDLMGMGEMAVYVDKPAGRIVAVMAAMNSGYELDMNKLESKNPDEIKPEAAPTGKMETINNYECNGYVCMLNDGVEMELWMTKDMPNSMHKAILNSFSGTLQSLQIDVSPFEKIINDGYAPIRTIVRKNGREQLALTLNKYERQTIDDAVFIIPSNITLEKR